MKKVVYLLRKYFKEHFSLSYFIAIVLFTAGLVAVEYRYDVERNYIDFEYDSTKRLLRYCMMYGLAFGGAYLLYIFSGKDRHLLANRKLWMMVALAVLLFSVRTWFHYYSSFIHEHIPVGYQTVFTKYVINLQGLIFLFIPVTVYWFWADRREQALYGFKTKDVLLKPYFILLLLMLPLLIGAATQPDFLTIYPRVFKLDLPADSPYKLVLSVFYELVYATDFVTTEFFFRGFLILAFARYAGPQAILPMCVFYVTIHFGKPLGETISSFFGGWILGILAYETRSIYGGIIVHLGIALMMELVAYIAHLI
jgi:membrane protease YdiL (CAAX protease family)